MIVKRRVMIVKRRVMIVKRRVINVSTAWDVCPRPWERSFGGAKLAA